MFTDMQCLLVTDLAPEKAFAATNSLILSLFSLRLGPLGIDHGHNMPHLLLLGVLLAHCCGQPLVKGTCHADWPEGHLGEQSCLSLQAGESDQHVACPEQGHVRNGTPGI